MDKHCSNCNQLLPISEFWKDKSNKDGYCYRCKACSKKAKGRRIKPSHLRKRQTVRGIAPDGITVQQKLDWIRDTKEDKPCACCGRSEHWSAMDYHHLDESSKEFSLSQIRQFKTAEITLEMIKQEIEKCVLLCAICHRMLHAGALTL